MGELGPQWSTDESSSCISYSSDEEEEEEKASIASATTCEFQIRPHEGSSELKQMLRRDGILCGKEILQAHKHGRQSAKDAEFAPTAASRPRRPKLRGCCVFSGLGAMGARAF